VGIGKTEFNQADTTAASPDPNPTDPWLFTDPMAFKFYQQHEQLVVLEDDISKIVIIQERSCDKYWAIGTVRSNYRSIYGRLTKYSLTHLSHNVSEYDSY